MVMVILLSPVIISVALDCKTCTYSLDKLGLLHILSNILASLALEFFNLASISFSLK